MQTIQKPQINLSGIPGFATFIKLTTKGKGEPIFLDMNAIESISTDTPYNDGTVEIRMLSKTAHHVRESIEHIILELNAVHKPTADELYGRSEAMEALPQITHTPSGTSFKDLYEREVRLGNELAEENRKLKSRLDGVLRQAKIKKDQIRNLIEKDGELFAAVIPIVQTYQNELGNKYGLAIPNGITNKNYMERLPESPYTSLKVSGILKDLEGAVSHWRKLGFGRMTKGIGLPAPNVVQISREAVDKSTNLSLKHLMEIRNDFLNTIDPKMAKAAELCPSMMKLVEKNVTDDPEAQMHIAAGFLALAQHCPEELQNFLDQLK